MAQALSDQGLVINPKETIRFRGPFKDVVTATLQLRNPGVQPIAFKVKTTAPRQYSVKPNGGVINPDGSVAVVVMLQPFDYNPNERLRHKFMIQSVVVQPGQNADRIWTEADPAALMDCKLRVIFENESSSNRSSTVTEEEYQMVKDQNDRLSIQIEGLRTRNELLRQQTTAIGQWQNGRPYTETDRLIDAESSMGHINTHSANGRCIDTICKSAIVLLVLIFLGLLIKVFLEYLAFRNASDP